MGVQQDIQGTPQPGQIGGTQSAPPMSYDFTDQSGQGGTGKTQGANYAAYGSQGYGNMPAGASQYSQALAGASQNVGTMARAAQSGIVGAPESPLYNEMQSLAGAANVQYQQGQQQFQQQMQAQQLAQNTLRTNTMQKLLDLFGGGGGAGAQNPAQGFLNQMTSGGASGITSSPLFQQLLQGRLGQVEAGFNDPGGLRSKMQQMNTSQNRYSQDSLTAAGRQNVLDRNRGIAQGQAFGGAFGDVIGPQLQAAQTSTQGWLGGQITPRLIAQSLTSMAGGGGGAGG